MKRNPSPARRRTSAPRPTGNSAAIGQRMVRQLRDRKTPLAQRVAMGIALLKAPAHAIAAERELQSLCDDPRLAPATFIKIGKALVRYEAAQTEKFKRERDAARKHPPDLKADRPSWDILLDHDLYQQWLAQHPSEFDKSNARDLGCSPDVVKDWKKFGRAITKLLRSAGVPQSFDAGWMEAHGDRVSQELAPAFDKLARETGWSPETHGQLK